MALKDNPQTFPIDATTVDVVLVNEDNPVRVTVKVIAKGALAAAADRHEVHAWGFIRMDKREAKLVERLTRAVLAGAVFGTATIKIDINGKRYISTSEWRVFGKRMNADLKRLGF